MKKITLPTCKSNTYLYLSIILILLLSQTSYVARANPLSDDGVGVFTAYSRLPLSFEANHGQAPAAVKFLSKGPGYTMYLTGAGFILALSQAEPSPDINESQEPQLSIVQMSLAESAEGQEIVGLEMQPGRSNYLIGNWYTNVPNCDILPHFLSGSFRRPSFHLPQGKYG
jgi:hypothetical protein